MNGSRKGAAGERELVGILKGEGFDTERGGVSYGTIPDVVGLPGIHIEVKRVEKLNIQEAFEQSERDSERFADGLPALFHRRNRKPWLVTMLLSDWLKLYREWRGDAEVTHWKALTNPDYLGAYSLEDGQDIILTVGTVTTETVTGPEGKQEECSVIHWKEKQKPMILNNTNAKMIERLLKTPYIEEWSGHRIQIGVEKVKAFGEVVDALRVRKFLPASLSILCEECSIIITGAHGMDASQLAEYTRKKYGKALCSKCATEAAKK